MNAHPWRRNRLEQKLSAYLDGELDTEDADAVGEHLAFDADARQQLRTYDQLDALTCAALVPTQMPDPDAATERLLRTIGAAETAPAPSAAPRPRRHLRPALLASIGLLVTAGVALAGLRRRGMV